MKEIKDFIREFSSEEKFFTEGKCFWFAVILKVRFGGKIKYHPVDNHWATEIDGVLYDVTGSIDSVGFEDWPGRFKEDTTYYNRLISQCILFDWDAKKETEYLCSNPEIMESILEGANEDLSECVEMEDDMF